MSNTSWSGQRVGFPPATRRQILERDNHTCVRCGAPATIADHIIPRAEGGSDDVDNGQALCDPCHTVKTKAEQARGRARRNDRITGRLTRPTSKHPGLL